MSVVGSGITRMTEQQEKAIAEAVAAAESCRKRAEWCSRIGLMVLAREYDYFAKSMLERVEWQRGALGTTEAAATTQTEKSE